MGDWDANKVYFTASHHFFLWEMDVKELMQKKMKVLKPTILELVLVL